MAQRGETITPQSVAGEDAPPGSDNQVAERVTVIEGVLGSITVQMAELQASVSTLSLIHI